MFETHLVVATAISAVLIASVPTETPGGAWAQFGIAGLLTGILFWIVSQRDPRVAEINAKAVSDAAEKHAAATRDAAETHAKAMKEFADAQREENRRQYDLLMTALKTPPPPHA